MKVVRLSAAERYDIDGRLVYVIDWDCSWENEDNS